MNQESYFKAILKILITGSKVMDQVTQTLKPFDISEPQFNVLRILRGQKGQPITVFEIQKRMIQRSSNVTRLVDKLLAKDLVSRSICEQNRRKMDIAITPKGLELLKKLDKVVLKLHKPYKERLTDQEAKQLKLLLDKLEIDQ
ncbi:MAG: MarR family winged helix-turn-helix transcriptional regulator [Cyclobacteriaceae bacterium]